ncbi:hypothetical protein [Streptomyces sp. NPDC055912]|uniref:hypothetical protein n=1 Tax=Streptomyces sp. NPDC055912 TaxID=3345660 RepID=UPI0035DBEF0A
MNARSATLRVPFAALACTAALIVVTACDNASTTRAKSGETKQDRSQNRSAAQKPTNGIGKAPGREIYDKATLANAAAGSFRERMDRSDTTTDLRLSATECAGTVDKKDHGSFEIRVRGNDVWASIDTTLAEELGNRVPAKQWVHGARDHPLMNALASYCHMEQLTHPDTARTAPDKGALTERDGRQAIPLRMTTGATTLTYLVAATGTPHLLAVDSSDHAEAGAITYSDFGRPVGARTPTADVLEVQGR